MKRKIYLLLPFLLLAVAFTACDETEEAGKYDNWRERNEVFVDSLQQVVDAKTDPELKVLKDSRNGTNIFYKILEEGDNQKDRAYLTSIVSIYRRGLLINESVFHAAPNEKYYTRLYENLDIFQTNFQGDNPDPDFDAPTSISVNGSDIVDGLTEALLWMYPGARWELYIPYQSGYKTTGNSSGTVPGYSTLIFDVVLDSVVEY